MIFRRWMLVGLLMIPLVGGCGKKEEVAAPALEKFDTPWSCEEHWMVAGVVRDLQGMANLAGASLGKGGAVPGKAAREYQIDGVKLTMSPSCWDLASYRPLLAPWKAAAQTSAGSVPDLLHELLTPTAKALQSANHRVSERLKATPASAEAHEEAAFLLGVFGIRQNARQFGDLRPLLGRMTAHLAVAEHLRSGGKPSDVGVWAKVLYDYHAGRPLAAKAAMQPIVAEGDAGRWKRVVELLIIGDWRQTGDVSECSLAESIAHARALQTHIGFPEMMAFVGQRKDLQAIPEWSRLLASPGHSVEEGHLAMKSVMAMEFLEMAEIFSIGKKPTPAKIAGVLAVERPAELVGKDGVPQVISDADWAGYFRRHLYMVCSDISRFALRQWGAPEAAAEWGKSVMPYLRDLPDHELVAPLIATGESDYQNDLRKTADYILHHPEKAPMGLWFDYRFPNLKVSAKTNMPDQVSWFREVSPPGTAHEPCRRMRFTGIHGGDWVTHIKALHQIDPWNSALCYELAENTGNNPESVKSSWGAVRDFSKRPLLQTLESPQLTSAQRIETLRILAPIDPEAGLDLGNNLVMENRPEEAILAYETAYEKTPDRVAVANQTRWMIHYYKSHGQDAKAREVADHNEKVYSDCGLDSALALALQEKDSKRAHRIADEISERYGERTYLVIAAWFVDGDEKALRHVFPEGLKEVTMAELESGESLKGARIEDQSSMIRTLGMRAGDVIVAIDGKRVETFDQYVMLMSSSLDPRTRIIYRRGKKLKEIDCLLPDRRLHVSMTDSAK